MVIQKSIKKKYDFSFQKGLDAAFQGDRIEAHSKDIKFIVQALKKALFYKLADRAELEELKRFF